MKLNLFAWVGAHFGGILLCVFVVTVVLFLWQLFAMTRLPDVENM